MGKKLAHLKKVFSIGRFNTERIETDAFVGVKVYGVLPYSYILFFDKWTGKFSIYENNLSTSYGIIMPHIQPILDEELEKLTSS